VSEGQGPGKGPTTTGNPSAKNITPLARVLSHLEGVRKSGAGFVAKCPHHDDRTASLSIKEGTDGRVLLHCFRGCPNLDVVTSAGLSFVDLFPPGSRERLKTRVWKGVIPIGPNGRPSLLCMGDDRSADLLGELARLSKVRDTLDKRVADALRVVAEAVGVSRERLAESVRAAVAGDEEPA
jgi:hypothetical protein